MGGRHSDGPLSERRRIGQAFPPDAFAPCRRRIPTGGFIHAITAMKWGDFSARSGRDPARAPPRPARKTSRRLTTEYTMVESSEELDAHGDGSRPRRRSHCHSGWRGSQPGCRPVRGEGAPLSARGWSPLVTIRRTHVPARGKAFMENHPCCVATGRHTGAAVV